MTVNNSDLRRYITAVRDALNNSQLDEIELKHIYFKSIEQLERDAKLTSTKSNRTPKYYMLLLLLLITITAAYNAKEIYKYIMQTIQEYIYPALWFLRVLFIPIIKYIPSLTDLYDESCLIQNPMFKIVGMDCWPCENVKQVGYLQQLDMDRLQYKQPFLYKTNQHVLNLTVLYEYYLYYKYIFDKEVPKVYKNNEKMTKAEEMFQNFNSNITDTNYYVWRINRIAATQIFRKLIPRPEIIPQRGQSTEKFLIIDFNNKSLRLPDTECNFTYLLQLKGERLIRLLPVEECRHHCKPLTVKLTESNLLWYNWWYWRPKSIKYSSNATSITYVGSHC